AAGQALRGHESQAGRRSARLCIRPLPQAARGGAHPGGDDQHEHGERVGRGARLTPARPGERAPPAADARAPRRARDRRRHGRRGRARQPDASLRGGGRGGPRPAGAPRHPRTAEALRDRPRGGAIMSRIYGALKKLEAERQGRRAGGRNGGSGNGGGNGGNGRNGGNGKRRKWRRLFGNGKKNGHSHLSFDLGPEVEEAYQRLGTNLLMPGGAHDLPGPRLLGVTASRHGEGATTTAAVLASILVRRPP